MNIKQVLIVGGGLAGIVCTLQLLDQGLPVTLVDRDVPDRLGGLAKESFGGILMVDTPEQRRHGIRDHVDMALQDWLAFGGFAAEPQEAEYWPRQWAAHYLNDSLQYIYHWLHKRGIRFLPVPMWVERGTEHVRGNSVPRWHVVWGTGQGLVQTLVAHLQQHPQRSKLTLLHDHRVEALTCSAGQVSGCRGVHQTTGEPFELHASMVVIAAGGINGGDLSQVRQHWHDDWGTPPAGMLNGSHQYADGSLHRAAAEVGANLTHLDRQWNYAAGIRHWQPRKPLHGLSLVPPKSALWLNGRGQRIWPPLVSGFDTRDLVTQLCAQSHGHSWQLMNRRIALKELAISGAEFNPSIRNKSKLGFVRDVLLGNRWLFDQLLAHSNDVVVARTIDELADKMNALQGESLVQAATLRRAVQAYDAEVDKGTASTDPQRLQIAQLRQWKGDRLRTCKAAKILDSASLPLIAIREHIISRKSLGGIQTNLNSQVLDAHGQPIAGLYAIGEAAGFGGGGMHGLRSLEGTFLGGCIYSAQRAASAIAQMLA
ncbi:MAG: FAD-binding dehydrogenase [Brachymonas sp.]|nr:FAD-binding dehydrogenase [Brachymonas sp.]